MSNITFITNARPGEPELLNDTVSGWHLSVVGETGEVFRHPAPDAGWTHDQLEAMNSAVPNSFAPLDAYLVAPDTAENPLWIGSTEV